MEGGRYWGVHTGQEDFLRQVELATSYESLALLPNISIQYRLLNKIATSQDWVTHHPGSSP